MNINRDNYEEFFLLYADNELTDSEKVEVLLFVKDNKDLEEEFRMIHHTILKPDLNIKLADKSFLLNKNEDEFINEKNYEEVFVLYHDNELNSLEKKETEFFLVNHQHLQSEFELIGLARLTDEDSIVFLNKKLLYKKETRRKVIPVIFWRVLAAAVFIGFGLWVTQLYMQKQNEHTIAIAQPASSVKKVEATVKNIKPENNIAPEVTASSSKENPTTARKTENKNGSAQTTSLQKNNSSIAVVKRYLKPEEAIQKDINNQQPANFSKENIFSNQKIKPIAGEQLAMINKIETPNQLAEPATENNDEKSAPAVKAQTVSYVQDANANNQNYVFYDVTTDEFRKTKVGGFLKKVKRVIERNNPIGRLLSGDDRQVVSN